MPENKYEASYRTRIYNSYISRRTADASGYSVDSYRRWAKAAEKRLKGWLPVDLNVPILDLACGAGNCLFLLEGMGYSDLTGVDLGAEQLALAAQYAPSTKLINDDLFNFLNTNTRQYGLIVCFNIIEHLNKVELFPFLDLLVTSLRPGGRVLFETPNGESPWFGAVAFADLTHEWFFTPRGLADTIKLMDLEGYEARASSPVPRGAKSWIRYLIWIVITGLLRLWSLAETGSIGSGIYTRVFVATATKKRQE